MAHRYFALAVGVLIIVLTAQAWRQARRKVRRRGGRCALIWVCVQGLFGALTVTMKLQPAIVTVHLLGGIGLWRFLLGSRCARHLP